MVKQGYKQTGVGVIPEDWDVRKIGDFTDATAGGTPSTSHPEYWNGEILWMSSGELNNRRIHNVIGRITELGYNNSSTHMIPENCVLIGLAGQGKTRGTVAVNYVELCTNQSIAAIFPSKEHNSEYLYQNLWSRYEELRELSSGDGGRGGLNLTIIKNFPCAFPKLQEQNRIAEALSDVDSMISSLEKLIAKKKAVKQGAMQELLTGKKRLPGFTGEWKSMPLGEIGIITGSGVDKKTLPDESPITLLNYTNVYHQISIVRKDLNHRVTASIEKIKTCSVLKGDVFLTPTSETPEDIALSAVASEDMEDVVYSYHVVRLRPNLNHNGAFINYALSTPLFREQAVQFAEGSGIRYVITLKKFKEMQVYLPVDKTEQNAIVSILSDMDNEIETLEQKLAKTRQIKQGMMQQLLTGKIRLV